MKKILVLLMAVFSVSAAFSQNGYYRTDRQNGSTYYHRDYNSQNNGYNNGYNTYSQNNGYYGQNQYGYNQNRYDERYRRAEIDRINRECDQQIIGYRNDGRLSSYERQRRIQEIERSRQSRIGSFGGGVVVGALATLVLGAILHH